MRAIIPICIWIHLAALVAGAAQPEVVDLWPGGAPEETGEIGPEQVHLSPEPGSGEEGAAPTRLITRVTNPTLSIHRPPKAQDTGTAILICPGGGYWDLYWELEGEEVAAWLNSIGVTGMILKYRVPRRPDEPKSEPARRPLQDAQRAVSLVRSKALEWKIQRIGMLGFSAGGHLVVSSATNFGKRSYAPVDAVDQLSCRPDFAIVVYPGYLKAPDKDALVPGLRVPDDAPPMFLVHGGADRVSSPRHSVLLYQALKRAKVSAELHIYAGADHGFGVRADLHPGSAWTEACGRWLRSEGLVGSPTP